VYLHYNVCEEYDVLSSLSSANFLGVKTFRSDFGTPRRPRTESANRSKGKSSMNKLLSIEAAADVLSISKWTVRSYIRTGKLKPVRIGRRILLTEAELERLITAGQDPPEATPRNGEPTEEAMR
jgi:excisionase family DNA binding protein